MSTPQFSRELRVGEFELNLETAELRSNGGKAILPGQSFRVLVTLLDSPGQLVTREELKRRLWPSRQVTFGQLPMIDVVEAPNRRLLSSGGDGRVWTVKPDGQRETSSDLHNVGSLRACVLILFTSFEGNTVTLTRGKSGWI